MNRVTIVILLAKTVMVEENYRILLTTKPTLKLGQRLSFNRLGSYIMGLHGIEDSTWRRGLA